MKILMTADTVGGVWTYALELARVLGDFSVEVVLATMGRSLSRSQRREAEDIPHLHVFESKYQLEWMDSPWDDVDRAGEWLMELAAATQPAVVHLNNYAHGALDWPVPLVVAGHSCVLSWWRAVKWEDAPRQWETYRSRVTAGLRRADLVVAPTQWMLDSLRHDYGPFARCCTISNGRTRSFFAPAPKEELILTVGRLWDEAKNIAALEAVASVLPWPICVAGETDHPVGGRRALHHLQPLGQLALPALTEWMGRAAIYALPARYEPFGLSALEAALSGCALVLSDIPPLREVWDDAALYVPPDEPDRLRETLDRLIQDRTQREKMAHRALQRARLYTPRRMGISYWTAYQLLRRDLREQVNLVQRTAPVPVAHRDLSKSTAGSRRLQTPTGPPQNM